MSDEHLQAELEKTRAEANKYREEAIKLRSEGLKYQRETLFYPFVAGAGVLGAAIALVKIFLH